MVVDWSSRHCVLCGKEFSGRTFLCRDCSDRYRNEPITSETYAAFYEGLDRQYPARSNTYGAYNQPAGLMRAIDRLPRNVRILELGAGGGHLGERLVELGFRNVTLSDFTVTTLAAIQQRLPQIEVVSADASDLPFEDAAFDVVITTDVIEHLPVVHVHLAEVHRVLSSKGLYLVKTPNRLIANAYYRLRDMHDSYFWHPSMFSPGELRSTFDAHGFDVHLLPSGNLTGAQLAKLPGPAFIRPVAGALPLGWLPAVARPHLEAVARKR